MTLKLTKTDLCNWKKSFSNSDLASQYWQESLNQQIMVKLYIKQEKLKMVRETVKKKRFPNYYRKY